MMITFSLVDQATGGTDAIPRHPRLEPIDGAHY
jgi:hypothetical protein